MKTINTKNIAQKELAKQQLKTLAKTAKLKNIIKPIGANWQQRDVACNVSTAITNET